MQRVRGALDRRKHSMVMGVLLHFGRALCRSGLRMMIGTVGRPTESARCNFGFAMLRVVTIILMIYVELLVVQRVV